MSESQRPKENDLFVAMTQKDYPEIMRQVNESTLNMQEKLGKKMLTVESNPQVSSLVKKIDGVCNRLITLGEQTSGELADENGPFSNLQTEVEVLVRECYATVSTLLMKSESWTPRASEVVPSYVAEHFFSKDKFPYIKVSPEFQNDQNGIRRFYKMNVEFDEDAVINAIDKI